MNKMIRQHIDSFPSSFLTNVTLDKQNHITLLHKVIGKYPIMAIYNSKNNKTIFIGGRGKHNTAGYNHGLPIEGGYSISFASKPPFTNQTSIYSEELGRRITLHLYDWGAEQVEL